jgi:hypothetical protein
VIAGRDGDEAKTKLHPVKLTLTRAIEASAMLLRPATAFPVQVAEVSGLREAVPDMIQAEVAAAHVITTTP